MKKEPQNGLENIKAAHQEWQSTTLQKTLASQPESRKTFTNISGRPIDRLYTPLDIAHLDTINDIGHPGDYPYTRGIHATGYRGKLWTMRQFSGFGTAAQTNQRLHYLLEHGQTGLSVAFHLPTLMGYDSDTPRAKGEVGKCGVAIDSLRDFEVLFKGIPMEKVTTSMTTNAPASILFSMYLAVAKQQKADWKKISGTIQNDILKEYIAQKTWIYPPRPSLRLITDIIEFATKEVPRWNTISVSGYHIREAGSTAVQELAFTLADGICYVQHCLERGMNVDDFAPRLSFFFNAHNDFFEEIAKYRAARKIWAKVMKERFGAKNQRSWTLRFHTQTAGCSLTAQQPYNNVVRVTLQALAAVMGGCQSLHTNSLDETLALPTEEAVTIALRTQQIIAYESGVADTVDPLGGSYYVEWLTDKMEREAFDYINKIDEMGGMVAAVERQFPQREIANASYAYQKEIDAKEKIIVGVNKFVTNYDETLDLLQIPEETEREQVASLQRLRKERDHHKCETALRTLKEKAAGKENLMPYIIDCVSNYATLGETVNAMKATFGEYTEPGEF